MFDKFDFLWYISPKGAVLVSLTAKQGRGLRGFVRFVYGGIFDAVTFIAVVGVHFLTPLPFGVVPPGGFYFVFRGSFLSPPDSYYITLIFVSCPLTYYTK